MKQRLAFAIVMGLITTASISFALIAINKGFNDKFLAVWLRSWAISYVLAFLSILFISPRIQLLVIYFLGRDNISKKDD